MIQQINCANPTKKNNKAVYFGAKFEYSSSVFKQLEEAKDAIDKFSGKTDATFDVEKYLLKLKEDFEQATQDIIGTVSIYKDELMEGINVSYRDLNGKGIFASIPALKFFKKDPPAHETIIQTLKGNYNKLFESTNLPESNPFKN